MSLELLIGIVMVLWLLGAFVVPIGGGAIHLLLVIVLVLIVLRVLQGRSVL